MTPRKRAPRPPRKRSVPPPPGAARAARASRPPRVQGRRPPTRRASPWPALGLAVVATALVAWAAVVLGYGSLPHAGKGAAVALDWPDAVGPDQAGERLEKAGLVGSAALFALYVRATGGTGAFRAGPHLVRDDLSARALVARLERSFFVGNVRVTIPEGFHRFDVGKRLEQAGVASAASFVRATADPALLGELGLAPPSAEGFLFPATYELPADADPRDVVRRMKSEHDKRWERVTRAHPGAVEALRDGLAFGPREIVTLASMVEKEAAVDDERPLVASVFLNRLRDPSFVPHRLQSDPTSAYGCLVARDEGRALASCEAYAGGPHVTPEMNRDDANAYSTYRHDGLPPGPIANPGEKSIAAVLAPADAHYLYFVARGEGRHVFSETYERHQEAIKRAR